MVDQAIAVEHRGSAAWVWLNRPEVHNAFDAALIADLTRVLRDLDREGEVRVVVLAGRGSSFSAGAKVQWMQEQGAASREKNKADAQRLAELMSTLAHLSKPTVARVQGAALGGGVGLICACDIAIGSSHARLGTTEVRLGLIPAVIAPYVVRAIGERQARRLFQTGERLDARAALGIGFLHILTEPEELDDRVQEVVKELLAGAPGAQKAAKQLIHVLSSNPFSEAVVDETVDRIADQRSTPEAAEGLRAFLDKRSPTWVAQE